MYTLKTIVRRSAALGMAASLLVAAVMPGATALADALNPLTERSLLLSSSAPGYQNTDGSSNPTYAPPGSGPNGQKTGETFTFTVSTASPPDVKGMSFQYCTTAAGLCRAPGNNNGDDRTPNRELNAVAHDNGRSDLDIVGPFTQAGFGANAGIAPGAGEFQIYVDGVATAVDDWEMALFNAEDNAWVDGDDPHEIGLTGTDNYIALYSPTGLTLAAGDEVQVVFEPSETIYITNPGYGAFFVKINTYDTDDYADAVDTDGDAGDGSEGYTHVFPLADNFHIIDGGVTVANVMTDSIHIVTKVLETMSFSVGIENPDTVDMAGATQHGTCDAMLQTNSLLGTTDNRLNLGNPNAEYSLETGSAWDVYSYWRLSSNSSGGATVYYSGNTLANTSGDMIADMPAETVSSPGTEQFGLAFVDAGLDALAPTIGDTDDTFQSGHVTPRSYPFITLLSQNGVGDYVGLAAQAASTGYDEGTGTKDNGSGGAGTAKFKFLASSNSVPEVIAQQNETVISCATAKMRYIGNIGADTPAGVYTTKINYLAAPQY